MRFSERLERGFGVGEGCAGLLEGMEEGGYGRQRTAGLVVRGRGEGGGRCE